MNTSLTPTQLFEFSTDGRQYFLIEDFKEEEQTIILKTIEIFNTKYNSDSENLISQNAFHIRLFTEESEKHKIKIDVARKVYQTLTRREQEILCFLFRGYQQNQISFVFKITINTVRQYRKQIYRKLEFKSKVPMVIWCEKYLELFFKHCE